LGELSEMGLRARLLQGRETVLAVGGWHEIGMMGVVGASLSRWHRVFAAALEQRDAVGLQNALREHLSRSASRSEMVASRRAAHSFAAAGHGRLVHVPTAGHGNQVRLVLVRVDAEVTPEDLAAAVVPDGAASLSHQERALHTDASRRLVATVKEAAAQARHIEASQVSAADCAQLAAALGAALTDLTKLRRRLARRTQTP
jgi:hypothetical protein